MTINNKNANLAIIEFEKEKEDVAPGSLENWSNELFTLVFIFEIKEFTLFAILFVPSEILVVAFFNVFVSILK